MNTPYEQKSFVKKLLAGYVAFNLPVQNKLNVYAGLRAEHNNQTLQIASSNEPVYKNVKTDFFPSLNSTFNFNDKNLLRLAFGRSVNLWKYLPQECLCSKCRFEI